MRKQTVLFISIACIILSLSIHLAGQTKLGQDGLTAFGGSSSSGSTDLTDSGGLFVESGEQTDEQNKINPGVVVGQAMVITAVEKPDQNIPDRFHLHQNYPNPFNPCTTIRFVLPAEEFVSLKIYDLLGREISVLVNENRTAGMHSVQWDSNGHANGIYLYRIESGDFTETRKLILQK